MTDQERAATTDAPPQKLWRQAEREHPDDRVARSLRYTDLMREAGHIIDRKQEPLPCGWKPLRNPRDLLAAEDQAKLDADLAEMAKQRRRVEAAARDWPMA